MQLQGRAQCLRAYNHYVDILLQPVVRVFVFCSVSSPVINARYLAIPSLLARIQMTRAPNKPAPFASGLLRLLKETAGTTCVLISNLWCCYAMH